MYIKGEDPKNEREKEKMRKNYIYGVSSKYNFGRWEHIVYHFSDMESAEKWLHTEEYDFREREIMGKTKAIKLAGKKAVENAIER